MGKKSRKKGGGTGARAARKEKLQERREQRLNDDREHDYEYERPYFEGDRVFHDGTSWGDPHDPHTYRGIVESVGDNSLTIVPLSRPSGCARVIQKSKKQVFPDFCNMTLRFGVGDRVVYYSSEADGWMAGTVGLCWPVHDGSAHHPAGPEDEVPRYAVGPDLVLFDHDKCIMKHPTSFRFSVGDSVVLDPQLAEPIGRSSPYFKNSSWVEGNISSVDIAGLIDFYVYTCSFAVAGKRHACHVVKDNDEHVARSDANPRDRLFDAIEQDCSVYHLDYLVTHFNIDVTTFRDVLVAKAIHFGSYHALAWLQYNCNIDVLHIKDNSGNTLLHKLASSPNAIQFIKKAGRVSCVAEKPDWKLEFIDYDSPFTHAEPMTSSLNASGETWLHILVRRGDTKALDVALSPHSGLAWELSSKVYFPNEKLDLLAECIERSASDIMQWIFDAFLSFRQLYQQCNMISYETRQPIEKYFPSVKVGEDAGQHAKRLMRFYLDWRCHSSCKVTENPFCSLVLQGSFNLFSLLWDANDNVFLNATYHVSPDEDRNEFLEPELHEMYNNDGSHRREVDIFMACVIGDLDTVHYRNDYDQRQKREYFNYLRQYAVRSRMAESCDSNNRPSLLSHLKAMNCNKKCDDENTFCKARIDLIQDDASLGGRLKILNYLLEKKNHVKLNILEVIRNRRCGCLSFFEDKGLVELQMKAASNRLFTKYASKLRFLERGRIPPSMTTACFLSFVAVEYDDLQSLQWICGRHGIPTGTYDGWNLLHFGGFMGRFEIIVWLNTQPCWHSLVTEVCLRKPFQHAFAIHIALFEGHTTLTETMMPLQVSTDDAKGKPLEFWGKKSHHEWVKQWAAKREKPSVLERNVGRLFYLLNAPDTTSQKVEKFIITSKCLEAETWDDCGYWEFDAKVMGYSLGDIFRECCSRFPDPDFAFRLCSKSFFHEWENVTVYKDGSINNDGFWGGGRARQEQLIRTLNRDELLSFAEEESHNDLVSYLQKRCFKDISCVDPLTCNFLLKSTLPPESTLLPEIRAKILRLLILIEIASESNKAFKNLIQHGGCPNELGEILSIKSNVKNVLIDEGYAESNYKHNGYTICELLSPLNMLTMCYGYHDEHPLGKHLAIKLNKSSKDLSQVHFVLVREGNAELLEYCLRNLQGWTVDMEYDVARSAAFLGHLTVVDIFLCPRSDLKLLSEKSAACVQVMLGFGEACLHRDLSRMVQIHGPPNDPAKDEKFLDEDEDGFCRSLLCAVLHGYSEKSFNDDIDNRKELRTLRLLVGKLNYTHEQILGVMKLLVPRYCLEEMCDFVDLLENLIHGLCLQPFLHNEQMQTICNKVATNCQYMSRYRKRSTNENPFDSILNWLNKMAGLGIDLQTVKSQRHFDEQASFFDHYQELQRRQQNSWSQFDAVKNGQQLEEIQALIKSGALVVTDRDRGGLMLTHLSAAYNRVDLLEWLVITKGMDINSVDGQGRTTLDVAKAAQASLTMRWIMEWQAKRTIVMFVKQNCQRLLSVRKIKRLANAATSIQRCHRGYLARKLYSGVLLHQLEDAQRFSAIWGYLIKSCQNCPLANNWSSIREQFSAIKRAEFLHDETYFEDTDEHLIKALESTMKEDKEDDTGNQIDTETLPNQDKKMIVSNRNMQSEASWLTFQLTSHIVKFLKQGDAKYKVFFVRRMQQLANGERSRILQKRLKGSQSTIFETYLEQKSGFRILWTEEGNGIGPRSIVIWFVAKHKEVSRLMKLIDDAKSRTVRQLLPESLISELRNENLVPPSQREGVLLDVFGNVPLKLYDVYYHNIQDITKKSWAPKLHLTEEERDVVEAKGTVLVLGRSGTGKTVCICNRIEHDRQQYGQNDSTFSQLFVARSKRLCRYVAEAVGSYDENTFRTFEELIYELHAVLPCLDGKRHFIPSQQVDFQRFKQEFHNVYASKEKKISALVAWTVIRTFIKGSIEAFQSPSGILPKESFLAVEVLGKNRCRVPANLREHIYEEFIKYEQYKSGLDLWDECDRTYCLLQRLHKSKEEGSVVFEQVRRSKIYVDEIQDYSQIECLIFFYLGGPGGLFLAGDPAQSVVEGTDFRFDEIRSLGYFVAGSERRDLIPQKPKSVNLNFRSHAGILNAAAAFLHLLFKYFPGSAKQLKKDHGLFQGSRPGVLHKVNVQHLADLVSDKLKGIVVLAHDKSVHHWRQILGNYPYCYGIREAKGLEFKTVMLLNFFQDIPSSLQKPWRNLLLNREGLDFETKHPLVETQLKLLYTGITRCIERLFIVETQASVAGDAVVRWLTTSSVNKFEPAITNTSQKVDAEALATRNNIDDIEAMSMTADEFLAEGFNNAEVAESAELDLDQACNYLDRAIWCFEQAGNSELAAKSRTHRQSVLFRIDLTPRPDSKSATEKAMIEVKGAKVMESLAKEGLVFEVLKVLYSIRPFLELAHYNRLHHWMMLLKASPPK